MTTETTGTSEIPLPTDNLILMDLDKTLIDASYNLTDESVITQIQRVQSLGWKLGLSSDTPLEPLVVWAEKLGLNGPILAEKGAIVYIPEKGEFAVSTSESFFKSLKDKFIDQLKAENIPYFHGDATQFIRNNPKLPDMVDKRLVAINAYRRCSLSFFTRTLNEDGEMRKDGQLFRQAAEFIRPLWANAQLKLVEDANPEYGIYILAPEDVSKRKGTQKLMELLALSRIGIIGDSKGDIIGKDLAIHYAVGNATADLRQVADYTAEKGYSSGVAEILGSIK